MFYFVKHWGTIARGNGQNVIPVETGIQIVNEYWISAPAYDTLGHAYYLRE
jgi:hypothetical protein